MTYRKVLWLALAAAAWLMPGAHEAHANCLTNATWDRYKAGDEYVDQRGCRENGVTRVEIRNTNPYDICVTVVATKTGRRWNDWPVASGDTLDKIVNFPNEVWRIGAVEKTKSYCG